MNSIEESASRILGYLAEQRDKEGNPQDVVGSQIADATGLSPPEINDAVTILVESGLSEWLQTLGSVPYRFFQVGITPRGRFEIERNRAADQDGSGAKAPDKTTVLPPSPIGSPYGFKDEDWEAVAEAKSNTHQLRVLMGYQFQSEHYDSERLKGHIRSMFEVAVADCRAKPGALPIELDFRTLEAGYGEHLFNEIARDIISADIAVFETSDSNANVMVEMGVALTWGVRVLPIKVQGQPKPPSDISGQTWADYQDDGSQFVDDGHGAKDGAYDRKGSPQEGIGSRTTSRSTRPLPSVAAGELCRSKPILFN